MAFPARSVDDCLEQGIAGQAIRAMQPGRRDLSCCEKSAHISPAVEIDANPAHAE